MSSNTTIVDESRVPQILLGIIVPTLLGSIFVVARLYTRCIIIRNWGLDDTFIAIAWVTSLCLAVANGLFVMFGTGHHQIFQALPQVAPTLKLAFSSRLIYQFVLCLTKLGICTFYLRVFADRRSKQYVYLIIGFVIATTLVVEMVFIFLCSPVSDAWSIISPKCHSSVPVTEANAVFNILADIFLMIFAIPRVIPLQMNQRQKASLLLVVSLGILVIVASIVRTILVVSLNNDPDLTWNGYEITTWTTLEVSTGLFCASAPCIRPLLRKIAPGFLSTALSRSDPSGNGKSKSKPYGHGTTANAGTLPHSLSAKLSTRMRERPDAYELRSYAADEESSFSPVGAGAGGAGLTGNAFWVGKGNDVVKMGDERGDSRSGSEHGFASSNNASAQEILKTNTVSVTIEVRDTLSRRSSQAETNPDHGDERDIETASVEDGREGRYGEFV